MKNEIIIVFLVVFLGTGFYNLFQMGNNLSLNLYSIFNFALIGEGVGLFYILINNKGNRTRRKRKLLG